MWNKRTGTLLAALLTVQLLLSTSTAIRGFPYFGSSLVHNAPVWELPIAVWHLPAIQLLSVSGYCCGLRNQLVFEARVRGGHVPMKPLGSLILAGSSWLFWSTACLVALRLNRRRAGNDESRRDASESADPRPQPRKSFEEFADEEVSDSSGSRETEHAGDRSHQNLRDQ